MSYKVGVIRGDGIGPEIVAEALKVLDKVAEKYNETFDYTDILLGGASIDATGKPLTEEALETVMISITWRQSAFRPLLSVSTA